MLDLFGLFTTILGTKIIDSHFLLTLGPKMKFKFDKIRHSDKHAE